MCHAASPAATNTTRRRSPPSLPLPRSPLRPMLTLRAARRRGRARPRLLTDHVEEPLPARSAESGQRVPDPLDDARPVVLLARRLVGPVDEQRASLDLVDPQAAPGAAGEQMGDAEFVSGLPSPTSCNLLRADGLEGQMCMEISPLIIYPIIDRLLGGSNAELFIPQRPLTVIEWRLVKRITDRALTNLTEVWSNLVQVQF